MTLPMVPLSVPRRVLILLYALAALPKEGATYRGLAFALGFHSERGLLKTVQLAKELGMVALVHTGHGRGAKTIVRVGAEGFQLLRLLGR